MVREIKKVKGGRYEEGTLVGGLKCLETSQPPVPCAILPGPE
jgi:hypothetical protein